MLVKVCTAIFVTLLCGTLADCDQECTPNVGTVLFSTYDMKKKQWPKTDISLLRARRYFQTILPPPDFISTFSEDYIHILLEYFRNSYANIKREATDFEMDTIMTTALSDVVGGYLKVCVIPVAKLGYYGGTISQNSLFKLYLFYDEIKRYLDTDGDGWHLSDKDALRNMTINIAPKRVASSVRMMRDPCGQLAYFEKTENGLGIPLPSVHWDEKASTLFVPLKNLSLIPMNQPSSSNTLSKYYDIARNCIIQTNPTAADKFEEAFQSWLSNEIVPHLRDDNLYLALGNVLTLLNKTHPLGKIMKVFCSTHTACPESRSPIQLTSKRMVIILILLLFEIAWCIPALIYILCIKKKKDRSSNLCLFIDQGKPDKKDKLVYRSSRQTKSVQMETFPVPFKIVKDKETQRPSTLRSVETFTSTAKLEPESCVSHLDFELQYPSSKVAVTVGTGSRTYYTSQNQFCEPAEIDIENEHKKSSLKKIPDSQTQLHVTTFQNPLECPRSNTFVDIVPDYDYSRKVSSRRIYHNKDLDLVLSPKQGDNAKEFRTLPPPKRFEHGKEFKHYVPQKRNDKNKESKNASLKHNEQSKEPKTPSQPKRTNQSKDPKTHSHSKKSYDKLGLQPEPRAVNAKPKIIKSKSDSFKMTESQFKKTSDPQISKTLDFNMLDVEEKQSHHNYIKDTAPLGPGTDCVNSEPNEQDIIAERITQIERDHGEVNTIVTEDKNKSSRVQSSKVPKSIKPIKASYKVTESENTVLEITIDQQAADISVDLRGRQISQSGTQQRLSKIPKLNTNPHQCVVPRLRPHLKPKPKEKRKSMIPLRKRKTVDDMVLTQDSSETSTIEKLNSTF